MQLLIQAIWIEKEAKDHGVSVTDADVQSSLAQTKRQSFPTKRRLREIPQTVGHV